MIVEDNLILSLSFTTEYNSAVYLISKTKERIKMTIKTISDYSSLTAPPESDWIRKLTEQLEIFLPIKEFCHF